MELGSLGILSSLSSAIGGCRSGSILFAAAVGKPANVDAVLEPQAALLDAGSILLAWRRAFQRFTSDEPLLETSIAQHLLADLVIVAVGRLASADLASLIVERVCSVTPSEVPEMIERFVLESVVRADARMLPRSS